MLQNFYVSQMLAALLGVRLGSWHSYHMEGIESSILHSQATRDSPSRPFPFQSIRFWLLSLWEWGGARESVHMCTMLGDCTNPNMDENVQESQCSTRESTVGQKKQILVKGFIIVSLITGICRLTFSPPIFFVIN